MTEILKKIVSKLVNDEFIDFLRFFLYVAFVLGGFVAFGILMTYLSKHAS